MDRFRKLAAGTTALTLMLIALGAVVRVTKSGLGCGTDWPHCHGKLLPSLERTTVAIEYSHRITASVVGLLVAIIAVWAWLKFRSNARVFWPSFVAFIVVLGQGWLGRNVVVFELKRLDVVMHFIGSLTLLALLTLVYAGSSRARGPGWTKLSFHGLVALVAAFTVLLIGAFVSQFEAALAFADWPLMDRGVLPPEGGAKLLHWSHRIAAALLGVTLAHLAVRATRTPVRNRLLLGLAHGAFSLWVLQVAVGALNVLGRSDRWAVVAHVFLSAAIWMVLVLFAAISLRTAEQGSPEPSSAGGVMGAKVAAYFFLTKPRIVELLLITTVPAMVLAERGWPPIWLVINTLIGGSLTAGAANAINCYLDRDIDEKMARTKARPLPRHAVEPRNALVFGVVLALVGSGWLGFLVGWAASLLALSALLFYVFVYTMWMKRTTPSNIVIGGAAGAVPALVGWAAVTGDLGLPAWILFGVIFYWTPPHFWALAIQYEDEYRTAGVPMLPVAQGRDETNRQILLYSLVLGGVSLLLVPAASMGWIYFASCLVLNAMFIAGARRMGKPGAKPMRLFHLSLAYLVLLFASVAVDPFLFFEVPEVLVASLTVVAVAVFVMGEALIVASVLRYRAGAKRGRFVLAEVGWTLIPAIGTCVMALSSGLNALK